MKKLICIAVFFLCLLHNAVQSQVISLSTVSVTPSTTVSAGQTVQITYLLDYTMLAQKQIKLDVSYGTKFTFNGINSLNNNIFGTPTIGTGTATMFSVMFNTNDNNFTASNQFTLTFTVNYSDCVPVNESITTTASTWPALSPSDQKSASYLFSLDNSNSSPTVTLEHIGGEECQMAMYKITSLGLDLNTGAGNSFFDFTLPVGMSIASIHNGAGQPVTFSPITANNSGPTSYAWKRNGTPTDVLQLFYVVINFSSAFCTDSASKNIILKFFSNKVCGSGFYEANASKAVDCCTNLPSAPIIPGITLSKNLIKTLYRYFPSPDNCKTHDYIIEFSNLTSNSLSNFQLTDDLANVLAGHTDGLMITGITVELVPLMPGTASFQFNATPTASMPLTLPFPLTPTSGVTNMYTLSNGVWPAPTGIWSPQQFTLQSAPGINFPAYSKLKIKITHRLDFINTADDPYINKATATFSLNGAAQSITATYTSKKDKYQPVLTIEKKVRNITVNPNGAFSTSTNAGPTQTVEFQVRIKNQGMVNLNGAQLQDMVTYLTGTNTYYGPPSAITVTGTGYTALALNNWVTALNPLNITNGLMNLPQINMASCPGYSEIVFNYTVLVENSTIVLCNSDYKNDVKLNWTWDNTTFSVASWAKVNIDLFQQINLKLEATCDTTLNLPWSINNVIGVPGTFMYYRATVRNNNPYAVNGLRMMVQIPNAVDNVSNHGTATLMTVVPTPLPAYTSLIPAFYTSTPPFVPSSVVSDSWLNTNAVLPAAGTPVNAIYQTMNLAANGGQEVISYRVVVPVATFGSSYNTILGVGMSLGTGCAPVIKQTQMQMSVNAFNQCKTLQGCEKIMLEGRVEFVNSNNFRITLSNILDAAGFNVDLMDVVVHQPYKDCAATGNFAKPMIPYLLNSFTSTSPPFILNGILPMGNRYYPLKNTSGSPVSFGDVAINLKAGVTASPVCPLVFPVNIRFKHQNDCIICERMIYLVMDHITTPAVQ